MYFQGIVLNNLPLLTTGVAGLATLGVIYHEVRINDLNNVEKTDLTGLTARVTALEAIEATDYSGKIYM